MERIKMKAEEQKTLRLSIPTENGVVIINNPSPKYKSDMVKELALKISKQEEIDERKMLFDLIDNCTNVEFEGDISAVQNLSHEAQMILNEVLIIFQEMIGETHQILRMSLQQARNEMLQNELLKESKEIRKDIEQEIIEEKIEERSNKKVNRPRGKAVRK